VRKISDVKSQLQSAKMTFTVIAIGAIR